MTSDKKINPLLKSSIIYVIATFIGQGMMFLSIIVFTRLMEQQDYGIYNTYYAYVSIITVLIGANLHYALNNAYIDKKERIKQFRKTVLILATLIMFGILFVAGFIGIIFTKRYSTFIVIMAIVHSFGFFVINYRIYSANMENDYKRKKWLLILPNTFQFVFSLVLILIMPKFTFQARVIGSALGVCVIALFTYVEILCCEGDWINREDWRYALSIALPSIIMSISYMLLQQCDKVMITNICGANDTAVYSVIYYLGYVLIAVDQAIAPVRQAWVFKRLDEEKTGEISNIQKWYLIIMMIITTGLLMVGPEVVKIIAPKSYWKLEYILPFVLSACMMMLYRFYTEVILFYKKNIILSLVVMFCALINIVLNALLIPKFGAVAACYTTVVAYFVLFLMTSKISNQCIYGVYSSKLFMHFILWISILAVLYYFIYDKITIRYTIYGIALILVFGFCLKNKDEWKCILWNKK